MTANFPVIASILSPRALIDEILHGFGLNAVTGCNFFYGGFNHTYQVRTSDDSTYYLSAYHIQWRTR
jgi:hypothetical protein